MRVIDGFIARARELGRAVGDGVADSGKAALYLRQLLRGNRGAPFVPKIRDKIRDKIGDKIGDKIRSKIGDKREGASSPGMEGGAPSGEKLPAPPVLLLHGYLATRGSVHLLERRLAERGHVVMTYRLGPIHIGDIRESAGYIARKIESLSVQTGVDKVDVVAHSMGGLVALDYLKRLEGHRRIRRLILLGTPTQGTWSAVLGLVTAPLGRAGLQLLPGSAFLRDLEDTPMPPGPDVVSIAGTRDWLAPPRTTMLPGVRHLAFPTGHSGLLVDEGVAQVVSNILSAPASAFVTGEGSAGLFDGIGDAN